MRQMREHDNGGWAIELRNGDWFIHSMGGSGYLAAQPPCGRGWHEAVVLTATDADARRFVEAYLVGMRDEYAVEVLTETFRPALERLAAGTEAEW